MGFLKIRDLVIQWKHPEYNVDDFNLSTVVSPEQLPLVSQISINIDYIQEMTYLTWVIHKKKVDVNSLYVVINGITVYLYTVIKSKLP